MMNDEQSDNRDSINSLLITSIDDRTTFDYLQSSSSSINDSIQIQTRSYSSQSNFIDQSSFSGNNNDNNENQHSRTNSISSSSTCSLSNQQSFVNQSLNINRKSSSSHKRTRSVDLRLSNQSNLSTSTSQSTLSTKKSRSSINLISKIEEKVSELYYKHGLFCSRHPALIILFSLIVVLITSYQIFTFRGVFGSSYDVYISSSSQLHDSILIKSGHDSVHPLMKHFNYWPDSYVRNELDDDQNVPPWFQSNLSYAYVQQIYIRSAVIPWHQDMQLVDALRAPFDTVFEIVEAVSNFQYKNDFDEPITLNDICFQVFEPTFSERYSHLTSHLPSYSCLTLSPANVWHGDRTNFLQDQNFLNTLLKFQDLTTSPVPSGAMHDIIFGVPFEDTGIRRTYGRNRVRTISYSITLILRKNLPEFIESLRTYLYKRYPLSTKIFNGKNLHSSSSSSSSLNRNQYETESQTMESVDVLDNKTKHIYFHTTFTYNYLIPLIIIYTIACFYMYFSVRKVEMIFNKRLYSLCTMITLLMSLFLSFGICFRLRFHSVLIVNRLLPYFVAGISLENILVLTKSVLINPHLDSKVRVAQALSKEGLSITKNLLAELTLLSIGSFTFIPFLQECCKIAAVCFLSDFFIQLTLFTPFFSLLVQRIKKRNKNIYPEKYIPRNIYVKPGVPVQHKTPKRLRLILFLARLRLVQRGFILILSACIGLAIYNAYLVLEQTVTLNDINTMNNNNINNNVSINNNKTNQNMTQHQQKSKSEFTNENFVTISTSTNDTLMMDRNSQKSFLKLLEINDNKIHMNEKNGKQPSSSSSSSSTSTPPILNPYYRISYSSSHNPMPKSFSNQHWTNLFSLYNISLTGRFISILPPILLSVPITPERAKHCRNIADSDYYVLKKFIPMKFLNGEYVISDDDDYDKFEKIQHWTKDDLHLIIGLWTPCLILFIYLIIQLYRCICTRNYAEWRSQISETNPIKFFIGPFSKKIYDYYYNNQDRLLRIDISIINYDNQKKIYKNEKQYLLNSQDIDLIVTNVQTSLVATSSLSGDLRIYDSLTCELLTTIKRTNRMMIDSTLSIFSYHPSSIIDEMTTTTNSEYSCDIKNTSIKIVNNKEPVLIKTEGNLLNTLFYGVQNDNIEEEDDDDHDVENNDDSKHLDFRPIWCMDIYDKYILIGCGGDDGRFEVWDSYNGQLSFFYYPDEYRNCKDDSGKMKKLKDSYAITVIKSTYWAVALARLNGQVEILELKQFKEDKYSTIFQSDIMGNSSKTKCYDRISYQSKFCIQAHKQPITRMEIIDSLEDEEFIRVFGSRGCLISGSMDTTLKVFALDNFKLMFTLNGHCGAIMTTAIDPYSTANALSGCQLGQMCVWDLNTGFCIFSMEAHTEAEIISIVTSPLYYVTTGTDCTICIWDRYSGHLIHRIPNQHTICRSMVFLEPFILVTVRDNELIIWDCNDARPICIVPLSSHTNDLENFSINNNNYNNRNNNTNKNNNNINDNDDGNNHDADANNNNNNDNKNNIHNNNNNNNVNNKWIKSYQTSLIKNLLFSYEQKSLICDYGNLLCVINNPFATKKND